MSFNFSVNFGYFAQTSIRHVNAQYSPSASPSTTNISGNIKVILFPRWYKHIVVQWSIPSDWGNCIFNIYASHDEDGSYERINPAPITGTYLLDTGTLEFSKFSNGFYIVEAILLDKNSVSIKSVPVSWNTYQRNWVTLRSNEIQRREHILLSKFVGIKSYLFKRKTYGERCPNCWSLTAEKVVKDHCTVCMGTSFKGGYFEAAPLLVQYESTPNEIMKTYFGKFEPNQIGGWTISIPEINGEDILIRTGDWATYRIEKMMPTELQGNTVRQMLRLTQLAKGEIENELVTRNLPEYPTEYK